MMDVMAMMTATNFDPMNPNKDDIDISNYDFEELIKVVRKYWKYSKKTFNGLNEQPDLKNQMIRDIARTLDFVGPVDLSLDEKSYENESERKILQTKNMEYFSCLINDST